MMHASASVVAERAEALADKLKAQALISLGVAGVFFIVLLFAIALEDARGLETVAVEIGLVATFMLVAAFGLHRGSRAVRSLPVI